MSSFKTDAVDAGSTCLAPRGDANLKYESLTKSSEERMREVVLWHPFTLQNRLIKAGLRSPYLAVILNYRFSSRFLDGEAGYDSEEARRAVDAALLLQREVFAHESYSWSTIGVRRGAHDSTAYEVGYEIAESLRSINSLSDLCVKPEHEQALAYLCSLLKTAHGMAPIYANSAMAAHLADSIVYSSNYSEYQRTARIAYAPHGYAKAFQDANYASILDLRGMALAPQHVGPGGELAVRQSPEHDLAFALWEENPVGMLAQVNDLPERFTFGQLLAFTELAKEYNLEWAIAMFEWDPVKQ